MTAAIHPKGSPFEQEKLFFDICEAAQEEPLQGDILRGFKKMSDTEEFQAVFGSENFEDKDRIANAFFALHKNVTASDQGIIGFGKAGANRAHWMPRRAPSSALMNMRIGHAVGSSSTARETSTSSIATGN